MIDGRKMVSLRITEENIAALKALAVSKRQTFGKVVNDAISEYVVSASKLRTIINSLARIRTQQNQTQNIIYSLYATLELFFERSFALAPFYEPTELRKHMEAGKKNFSDFVEEALRKNRNSKMPLIIERMLGELDDQEEKPIG